MQLIDGRLFKAIEYAKYAKHSLVPFFFLSFFLSFFLLFLYM